MAEKKRTVAKKKVQAPVVQVDEASAEPPLVVTDPLVPAKGAFHIVGIGASAGGIAALEAFFSGMPADRLPGMAFILVPHLAPDHKSILTELIQRYTTMRVTEVEDGMVVEPNCTYIIPPGSDMALFNGTLQLLKPTAPRGQRLPIDFFFRSLAEDQHDMAICIVLSGNGSDGTLGVRAIKGQGGMVIAQLPETTEYDCMPRSAIATGLVDYELAPADMPGQLLAYVAQVHGKLGPTIVSFGQSESALKKIFVLLRSQTSHDFSQYKPNTIYRRIARRMAVHQIEAMEQYVKYLQQNAQEIEALFRDLLIGVTNFFRDPNAFQALDELVVTRLLADKPSGSTIRVWSTGCSTGEEAYSLAILLQERLESMKKTCKVQVFATDIDSQAIAVARAGIYPASIVADIAPDILARHFTAEPDGCAFRINKNIRDMLVFSEQNVIKDPPFSRLDLISCRNLLIYISGNLQKKLIPLFHYALNPRGFLFLGTSETVGEFGELFAVLDRKMKIYQRKEDFVLGQHLALGQILPSQPAMEVPPIVNRKRMAGKRSLRELVEQTLLLQLAPAGALVNGRGDILYLHGRTGRFLEPPPGETGSYNIIKMAREGLQRELTTALHKAAGTKTVVIRHGLRVKTNGDYSLINLTIRPVLTGEINAGDLPLYLVIFEEAGPSDLASNLNENPADSPVGGHLAALRQELREKEEYLQTANEELETSNEELKSSNEEMQSVNEELQSTNEELETSKEELQSVNEELATVNAELQMKVSDLTRANNDMNNLLAGTGIATVFVDQQLRILRFTPAATKIINLILSDIGRPVGHIVSNLVGYDNLVSDSQRVLENLIPQDHEAQTVDGRWYTIRIQPYRTLNNVIEGVVISFVDISDLKTAQAALHRAGALVCRSVHNASDCMMVLDRTGQILAWNDAATRLYGWSETEALQLNMQSLVPAPQREKALAIIEATGQARSMAPAYGERLTKDGSIVKVFMIASFLFDETGEVAGYAITERA